MSEIWLAWLKFALCAGLIGVGGPMLARAGETIARVTGLSRSWIGVVLIATATSLPELFTGISAVAVSAAPNIAVGDALGSCVFNLLLLVILDFLSPDQPIYRRIEQGHILTAAFGVILIGFVGGIVIIGRGALDLRIFNVSAYTPLLVVLYFVAVRASFFYQRQLSAVPVTGVPIPRAELGGAIGRYVLGAILVAGAGSSLPAVGIEIADVMGWGKSFVGTVFVAAATSLPELVVTIAALRLGSVDMAVGNLLGSNLFNMLVIAVDDIAYPEGSVLAHVSVAHAATAITAIIMTGIFVAALLYRPVSRFFGKVGWVSIALLAFYILSSYTIFISER